MLLYNSFEAERIANCLWVNYKGTQIWSQIKDCYFLVCKKKRTLKK